MRLELRSTESWCSTLYYPKILPGSKFSNKLIFVCSICRACGIWLHTLKPRSLLSLSATEKEDCIILKIARHEGHTLNHLWLKDIPGFCYIQSLSSSALLISPAIKVSSLLILDWTDSCSLDSGSFSMASSSLKYSWPFLRSVPWGVNCFVWSN